MAKSLNIWGEINKDITKQTVDGETSSESDIFSQNYRLTFEKPITPVIRYRLDVRAFLSDIDSTDSEGKTTKSYRREIEPALDIFISNPMYNFSSGYRRREQWSTKNLKNDSRETTDFYHSGFSVNPRALPTLNLQFNREKTYDHLPDRETDRTSTRYTANSGYELPSSDLDLNYNISFSHTIGENPLNIIHKTENDSFSGTYGIGYNRRYWQGKVSLSTAYMGNYTWNKNSKFVSQTGDVLFERMPFGGLHEQGTVLEPEADALLSELSLVDNNFNTGISGIDIGMERFHNTGIWVASDRNIDRLYIYVNEDVSSDINLTNTGNWRVLQSNFNLEGTWTDVAINNVTVTAFDAPNNIYRYEIEFSSPVSASYFNAVNLETVNAFSTTSVLVTEIEAYGTDVVPSIGEITNETKFFSQRFNISSSITPVSKLTFSLNFSTDRADTNPDSATDSLSKFITDMFSDPAIDFDNEMSSRIQRHYGATATWLTHRLLTTILAFQRDEAFDTRGETDILSDTYSLTLNSSPLPTLNTTLIFINNEKLNFDEKSSRNRSVLLNIDSKLYRDVNMTTDLIYTQTKDFTTEAVSDIYSVNGTIDTIFTRRLNGSFIYRLNWSSFEGVTSQSKSADARITYQPARFINLSGSFLIADDDGDISTSEIFIIDWLPLRAIRLNSSYKHSNNESSSLTSDVAQGQVKWFINKFADILVNYNYIRNSQVSTTESHSFLASLNCRF